jgi:hypothetical protein
LKAIRRPNGIAIKEPAIIDKEIRNVSSPFFGSTTIHVATADEQSRAMIPAN